MTGIDRESYFHHVEITHHMLEALLARVNELTNQNWTAEFTPTFWFRIIDNTDPKKKRNFGWYENFDEVRDKFDRLFPEIKLLELDNVS